MIYIQKIFIISMFCVGLNICTGEGMILHALWNKARKTLPQWAFKPLIGCVYCFASFWGSIVYWPLTIYGYHEVMVVHALVMWPIICMCCVFVNGLLYGLYSNVERYIQ